MRTKNELYQEALRTVARRRQTARAKAEDARAEAEAAVPGLRHAEEEVRVRGIRCALAGAAGKDRTEAAAALSKARQELTALLAASGRPADALEPKFTCKLCQDTGSVQGRTCTCVHKLMQGLRREEIEALSSLSISSFDTMELRYYPNTVDEKLGEPVRTYMGGLLEDLRSYAEEFDHNSESLMLFGNAGLGKTHAALAIAGIVLEKGYDVIYVSSPDFFSKLEGLHFGADPAGEEETLMQTAAGAEAPLDPPVPPGIGRPHPDRGRQFMPFAALRGYYDLVHAKEAIPESRRPLSDDEARALDDLIANLDRGDVVRCRYYEGGGYREAEGAVSQIDVTFRDLWIVRRRIPFSAIQSLELLYPAS